jgi:hypothetical protein
MYLFWKPLDDYAASAGLTTTPNVLDSVTFYTADQGYQILSNLGDGGRNAYRLANYSDFILPILVFLSLSLPNLALNKENRQLICPLIYLISDYFENSAEKYVLEIYPERNNFMMNLTCYFGVVKMFSVIGSLLFLIFNGFNWIINRKKTIKIK